MTLRRHAHRLTSGDNSSHPPTTRPCAHRACLPTFHVLWNTSSLSRCRLSRAHTRLVYSISFRFSSVAIHFRPAFARLSVCFHCACEFGCPLLFVPCFFSSLILWMIFHHCFLQHPPCTLTCLLSYLALSNCRWFFW